jgi:hypothetical protein
MAGGGDDDVVVPVSPVAACTAAKRRRAAGTPPESGVAPARHHHRGDRGALLLRIPGCRLLWLDLHTKEILRCFSLDRLLYAKVYCLYEMDLSSWVPTFNSAVISFD